MMKIVLSVISLFTFSDFVVRQKQQQAIVAVNAFQPIVVSPSTASSTSSTNKLLPRHRIPNINNNLEFEIHNHQYEKEGSQTTVLEVPVRQNGVRMYIAKDGTFDTQCPGNGGMRLLSYPSKDHAIEDAVRLAEGMTRKHAMYNTGFSGAKLVVDYGSLDLKDVDREILLVDCAHALQELGGSIYTGCDINTHDEDMEILARHTPYVLAGMNSNVDTNKATAMSVIGSILGILESQKEHIQGNIFLVQGCGKVGTHVAKELVRLGAKEVMTCDLNPSNAAIQGCTKLNDNEKWYHQDVDFLVPCANSLAIDDQVLTEMVPPPRFIVGATNQPYASQSVRAAFDAKGSLHVPESISSAGAILADSIEWTNPDLFRGGAAPSQVYGWIQDLAHAKAYELCQKAGNRADCILRAIHQTYANQEDDPIGQSFPQWIAENTKFVDSLIVGGGMAGTAAAYANAKAGIKTLLVEQGDSLAPKCASSNGDSRMYRQMYSSPFFSKMQTAALEQWKCLEKESGEKLLHQNGLLFYGEDTGETVEGSVQGARDTMKELGLPHEYFATGDDIHKKFPALKTSGTPYSGVYEETAGHVRSSAACAAMARVAKAMGKLDILTKCKVTDIHFKDDEKKSIDVILEDGSMVVANSMIVAPGPWTKQFLQEHFNLDLDLDIWRIHWAHYEIEESINVPQCFFFRKESECRNDGGLYYCFPATATESRIASHGKNIIKVGVDFKSTQAVDEPATMDDFSYEAMEQVLEMMDGFVAEHLKGEAIRVEDFVSPYTMANDSYFIMDTLPGHSNIALFSGGSGRAFKFAPLLGDCLSRLASGNTNFPIEDISCFSINRPAVGLRKLTEDQHQEFA